MAKGEMTVATQKRMLTAQKSKLTVVNLTQALGQEEAWSALPEETRRHLYTLLPPPREGDPEYDADVHPLQTNLKHVIEGELRRWQTDLAEGRETKKWRDGAMEAARDHIAGKFTEQPDEPVKETSTAKSEEPPDERDDHADKKEDDDQGKAPTRIKLRKVEGCVLQRRRSDEAALTT